MDKIIESIHIRYFKAQDAEICFKIRSAAFIQKFYKELGNRATSAGVNDFMPHDYVRMAETTPFFVAEDTGSVIGFFTIERRDKLVAEIPLIYIDLNQLGKQIGQTLIEYIEHWVTANWPEVTTLIVDTIIPQFNSGFYKKAGFIPAGDAICTFPDMQVADLVCFARLNPDEYLSSGRTIDYSEKIYLNTEISGKGSITVKTPLSRAGDFIEPRARMDLIIGVTACSAGKCNNFRCTAVDVEVFDSREQS